MLASAAAHLQGKAVADVCELNGASWRATDALTATFGARTSGRQYSTLDNSDPNGFTFQGASRFLTTDLRLHYRLTHQWSAAFGIDNLNDDRYWNFHPYPQRT